MQRYPWMTSHWAFVFYAARRREGFAAQLDHCILELPWPGRAEWLSALTPKGNLRRTTR